jgi:tyrosinase
MTETVIHNPTYIEHVRHFFADVDLEHMFKRGLDLTTYPALKAAAAQVFQHTRPPTPDMPPDPARQWSQERSQSFRNWITDGLPLGTMQPAPGQPAPAERVRKDARDLSDDEVETLRRAFQGIMDRDPDDEMSYFALAGQHWYPNVHCLHHEDRYHPWHRVYMGKFEDALRSVPGCADVTIPYWDITDAPPEFLFSPPFDTYTLPRDIHLDADPDHSYPAGYRTQRFPRKEIKDNVDLLQIPAKIDAAMGKFDWGAFALSTTGIERAGHDNGHVATGITMSVPDAAAYDPIFWFFHSNWDRLWWEWQQAMQATTQWSFRSTVTTGFTEFLSPPFNVLDPFTERAEQAIDLAATGVAYAPPAAAPVPLVTTPAMFGSAAASRGLRVRSGPLVSVRLKGINRLAIPGSFQAVLKADGQPIGREAFFQSTKPTDCSACREKAVIDIDFHVDSDAVTGRDLGAEIELLAPGADRIGRRFPLRSAGDPTVNVRLLLEANR